MRAVSLFSGAGGFERGFERAGIKTILQCEIDPTALSVLRRHWPNVPKVEDVRTLRKDSAPALYRRSRDVGAESGGADTEQLRHGREPGGGVDLVYGGFPCQDISVAGKRAGLGGARSGLWHEFRRVLSELRPRWAVIENVGGLLHSGQRSPGADLAVILDALDELGFAGISWAVLDAQHFGVPQRRTRVFVVAGPSRRCTEAVLSICESCGGNPEKGGEAGEGVAASLRSRSASSGVSLPGRGGEDDANLVFGVNGDTGYSLRANPSHSGDKGDGGINTTLVAAPIAGHHHRDDLDNDTYVVADTLRQHPRAGSNSVGTLTVARGLTSRNERYDSETETLLPIQYPEQWGRDKRQNGTGIGAEGDPSYTLDASYPQGVGGSFGVRRLTPLECERLMGWPDDWTRWRDDGSEISDTHRYRLIGNGVVSTVAEWIGHRLVAAERLAP